MIHECKENKKKLSLSNDIFFLFIDRVIDQLLFFIFEFTERYRKIEFGRYCLAQNTKNIFDLGYCCKLYSPYIFSCVMFFEQLMIFQIYKMMKKLVNILYFTRTRTNRLQNRGFEIIGKTYDDKPCDEQKSIEPYLSNACTYV